MRWDNLTIGTEEGSRLPGYREPAVVRHFDAPEALDTRFYEVRAKSALNRVPERSRMPFRWTVNPYRGCTHACVYCLAGDTAILMADGITRALADLREGDQIYGTRREGRYRRFVATEVLAQWSTVRPAYRVRVDGGADLVASGDHRFLTARGWKFVTGSERGATRRPHLTAGTRLLGTGGAAMPPSRTPEYRRGYLCGMIRGDGHIGSYEYARPGRASGAVHRFRLALADQEALGRTEAYLRAEAIATTRFAFSVAKERSRSMEAIRASAGPVVDSIRALVSWPEDPSDDWRKGFLAGIFDAEGSCSRGVFRIPNTDEAIIDVTTTSLDRFGFDHVVEDRGAPNGLRTVRLRGGLAERMRFFAMTDPAITRKRDIDGQAMKVRAEMRVEAVEPLGMSMPMFDITTGTGDFIANGVVSHNCFARPTHTYLDMDAGRDFEREIVVKVNAPEVLRAELARPSWKGEHVAMGTNTDPYQWVESRYRLMRGIWEALRDSATPCSVLTKSPLLLRDLDLMREIAEVTDIHANLSVPTIDEKAWRASEPHTPSPKARLEAVAELNRAGIPTGILVAPLMPGINDDPSQVERILQAAADAGATGVGGIALHLRGEVRGIFMDWLRAYRPDLVERYERLYRRGAYVPREEQERLQKLLGRFRRPTEGTARRPSLPNLRGLPPRARATEAEKRRPGPQGRQETLFKL